MEEGPSLDLQLKGGSAILGSLKIHFMQFLTRLLAVSALAAVLSTSATAADPVLEMMPEVFARAAKQSTVLLQNLGESPKFPRSLNPDGSLKAVAPEDWTSGFFPGTLWLIHEYDRSPEWKEKAMAAGLVELAGLLGPEKGAKHLDFARAQMLALGSPAYLAEEGKNGGFILLHSTGHLPEGLEIDTPLCYTDYDFLETLLRYRSLVDSSGRKSFGDVR